MDKKEITIQEEVQLLLDGRTQRWLALEIKMPESELSKKMNGVIKFTSEDIEKINARLNGDIKL